MIPLIYNSVLIAATGSYRFTLPGITTDSKIFVSWGINASPALGNLQISEQGDGYVVITSDQEQIDDKNIVIQIIDIPGTATGYNLITLEAVKRYLKIGSTDYTQDVFLNSLIALVSNAGDEYCRRPLIIRNYVGEIYNGNGESRLNVFHPVIRALANNAASDVQYRNDPLSDWTDLEAETKYIIIDAQKAWSIFLYRSIFPPGIQNVKLNYTAGMCVIGGGTYPDVPGALQQYALEKVAEMFKESNQNAGRLGWQNRSFSSSGQSGSDTFIDLSPKHRALLDPYVWPMI
jgi:hypothetical protein